MRELNIRLGTAFVLVFDLTKEETLKSLLDLRQVIFNIKGTENIPIVLVGNKSDLVSEKFNIIEKDIESFKCVYIESSAKDNLNVSQIFKTVFELILKEIEEIREAMNVANNINRRNSSISFVRRISAHNLIGHRTDQSRRFSEPVCVDKPPKVDAPKKKKNSLKEKDKDKDKDKDSNKESLTPTSKRKQKNCIIS